MPHRNRDLDEEDNASDLGPPMDFEADAADKTDASADDPFALEDADELLVENETEVAAEPVRPRRRRTSEPPAGGSSLASLFGIACLIGGVVLNALEAQGKVPTGLTTYGLQPATLFVAGAIALGATMVRRQLALANQRIDEVAARQQRSQDDMHQNLHSLLDRPRVAGDRPPVEGEELGRILMALQRQDEKVNNLTKALKMYGKPLMEIASQGSDTAALVGQMRSSNESLLTTLRQGTGRLESLLTEQSGARDLPELQKQLESLGEQVQRGLGTITERLPKSDGLQQQLVRVEAAVQATSQRLDDSEVRKSLLRLEDAFKVQGKKLEEFARADALRAESEKVERQLHNGLGKLGSAIEQLREGNLGPIETVVRDLQRELASVATGMAQLQQLVRGLGSRAATAPPAPMPATPAAAPPRAKRAAAAEPEAATAPKAAAAEPAEAAPIDTTGLSDAQAGAAQNRTGARSSNSKNVLGAIAKLKQMKG